MGRGVLDGPGDGGGNGYWIAEVWRDGGRDGWGGCIVVVGSARGKKGG